MASDTRAAKNFWATCYSRPMYGLIRSKRFVKSFRKLQRSGCFTQSVREDLEEIFGVFARGEVLPHSFFDHQLKGEYDAYRECHIRGDLLLMYRKDESARAVVLSDIGTHPQLFG